MNADDLDHVIRETQHRYADTIHTTRDVVPEIFSRVQRTRRRRRAYMAVAAAAVTAAVIGAVARSTELLDGDTAGKSIATSPTTPGGPRSLEDALRTQLMANAAVREDLLGNASPQGAVLCSTHVFGSDRSLEHLYVWVNCGTYSTGPGARELSAGGDPALLTVRGSGSDTEIAAVQFPRLAHYDQDVAAMFPARIAEQMARREFQTFPTDSQLLAEASRLDTH